MLEESMLPFGLIDDKREPIQEVRILELEHVSFDDWMRS
jgi:hypothetical protein